MIKKRLCSLNTKVNKPIYDMVKIRVIIIYNVMIFTIYVALLANAITVLLIIHQNKPKMTGKIEHVWFIYKNWLYTSYLSIPVGGTVYFLSIK